MIFKVKWGDFEPLLKKKFIAESENKSPIFYFEDDNSIYLYQGGGYILCSSLLKGTIPDLVAFKQEYLADVIELTERPNEKVSLEIKTS